MVREKGYRSITRRSLIERRNSSRGCRINGRDVAKIYLDTVELGSKGYMKYRTVPVYPQVDKEIDIAIQNIASKQLSAGRRDEAGAGEAHRADSNGPASSSSLPGTAMPQGLLQAYWIVAQAPSGVRDGTRPGAFVILALITLGPALYLVVTSLTPLNLVYPCSALGFFRIRCRTTGRHSPIDGFYNSLWVQVQLSIATVVAAAPGRPGARLAPRHPDRVSSRRCARPSWYRWYCRRSSSQSSGRSSTRRTSARCTARWQQSACPSSSLITSGHGDMGDRGGRDLGMVPLHDADDAGRPADDPGEPIEAARIDGAGRCSCSGYIVLPLSASDAGRSARCSA